MANANQRVINHKVLRRGTGIIAFLLPILVSVIAPGDPTSISITYHTDAHDFFVGGLIAVAFFFAAYNGNGSCKRDLEFYYSKAAFVFATIVALVPAKEDIVSKDTTPAYIKALFGDYQGTVHNTAAVLLFIILILMVIHFSRRAKYKGEINRSRIYRFIVFIMIAGMSSIAIIGLTTEWAEWIYWLEFVGLWLFGIGWIIAGSYKTVVSTPPSGAKLIHSIKVYAANKDNILPIELKNDTEYYIRASGCWKDWRLSTTVTGWGPNFSWFTKKNRLKNEPIFMLCGSLGNDKEPFPIGHNKTWKSPENLSSFPPDEQQLSFWANDYKDRYGNNSGFIDLEIYECTEN